MEKVVEISAKYSWTWNWTLQGNYYGIENTAKQEWGDGESLGKDIPGKTLHVAPHQVPQPWLKTSSKREFGFLMSPKRSWVCLVPGLASDSF